MPYSPGDIYYKQFYTVNVSGSPRNADRMPIAVLVRNCLDDPSSKTFISWAGVGRYNVSGIIPINYGKSSVNLNISTIVNGAAQKQIIDMGQIGDVVNANLVDINGQDIFLYNGIAQTGSINSITLAASEPSLDNYYRYQYIGIIGGKGTGQIAIINSYSGLTRTAYIQTPFNNGNWLTIPDNTSQYVFNGLALTEVL